jgi:hypothetical protein
MPDPSSIPFPLSIFKLSNNKYIEACKDFPNFYNKVKSFNPADNSIDNLPHSKKIFELLLAHLQTGVPDKGLGIVRKFVNSVSSGHPDERWNFLKHFKLLEKELSKSDLNRGCPAMGMIVPEGGSE